jgi:hypothetical protein
VSQSAWEAVAERMRGAVPVPVRLHVWAQGAAWLRWLAVGRDAASAGVGPAEPAEVAARSAPAVPMRLVRGSA